MRLKKLTEHILYTECDSSSDRPVLGYINGEKFSVGKNVFLGLE